MTRYLDKHADILPYGLQGTPFEPVWRALQTVAASVWDVDPAVYRAGIAWGWYALHYPAALLAMRELVVAALISEQAPLVKDSQTTEELVEYITQWQQYRPTFGKLQALYNLFGARVVIRSITDAESQEVMPVTDTRLAFYIRIEAVDWSRPLLLSEAYEIAVRATPLGSRPQPYYAFLSTSRVYAGTVSLGSAYCISASGPAAIPVQPIVGESGWMSIDGDETFAAPRGEFDMSDMLFEYGGGEPLWMNVSPDTRGYLRSSAYQNANRALSANTEYYLYAAGSDTTIDGDAQGVYELRGAYTAADATVASTGATLGVSGGKLKLTWGPSAASVCYIIYRRVR